MRTLNTVRTRTMPGIHVLLILPDRLHETRSSDRLQFHGHCSMMCVNTVSKQNNKKKKTKKQKTRGLFLLLAFNFWPPSFPLPSLSRLPNRPLLMHPPAGCPETLHYCCHGNASIIWQWSRTLPPQPHLLLLVCSCLPALFSAASPPSLPPIHPNSLLLSLKTWLPDKKITKSQRQVGHMMMGRPPEVLLLSPQTP